jgi:hypothetical protein
MSAILPMGQAPTYQRVSGQDDSHHRGVVNTSVGTAASLDTSAGV